MHSSSSFWAIGLVISCLSSFASGRAPVDELFKRKRWEAKAEARTQLIKRDQICIDDDALIAFQNDLYDSVPFCSTYLGIPQATSTSTSTTRVTSIELVTTTRTADQAVTVASNTITVTITAPPAPPAVLKRQATGGITQAAQIISQCLEAPRDGNLTVISVASSACSCLFIPTTTVTINTIATSTRTEKGINYKFATRTVTDGEATVTITVIPVGSVATPPISAGSPTTTGTLPPLVNSTVAPPGTGGPQPSSDIGTVGPSGVLPPAPSTISIIPIPTTVSPPSTLSVVPIPIPSSAFPPSSVNFTGGGRGGSDLLYPVTTPSGAPTAPSNETTATATSGAPSATPSLGTTCPAANGTTYTTNGQTFLILCDTNFIGPSDQGLFTPDLYTCIADCAIVNIGFSADRCYAASYVPNNYQPDCFFRTSNQSHFPEFDPKAISAILINNTLAQPSGSGFGSSPSNTRNSSYLTGPTAYPSMTPSVSANVTISPTGVITVSSNSTITSLPSGIPTVSYNSTPTYDPSGFPTASSNITATSPSGYPTLSMNKSAIPSFGYPTGDLTNRTGFDSTGVSSGWPSPTANSSMWCSGMTTTVTDAGLTITSFIPATTVTVYGS